MVTAYAAWLIYHGRPIPLVAAWLWINELWAIGAIVSSYRRQRENA